MSYYILFRLFTSGWFYSTPWGIWEDFPTVKQRVLRFFLRIPLGKLKLSYFTDASENEAFCQGWIPAILKSICLNYQPTSTITGVGIPKHQWKEYIVKGIRSARWHTDDWCVWSPKPSCQISCQTTCYTYIYFWKPALFCCSCYWQLGV